MLRGEINVRFEEDDFGWLPLPDEALYGIHTRRSADNLSFSGRMLRDYPEYVEALALVKKAAARANARIGAIPDEIAGAIEQACDAIVEGNHREQFIVDVFHGGGGTGVNMNINEVAANLANERLGGRRGVYAPVHPIDHVNASQSTSDVCHTAMRIAIVRTAAPLERALAELIRMMDGKAEEFASVPTIARTCLQDGLAVPLGTLFSACAQALRRRDAELARAVNALHAVNLGGTVIGTGTGAPAEYRDSVVGTLCEVSGLPLSLRDNLYDAAQHIDDLAQVAAQLELLCGILIKISKDLRLLSSGPEAGFGEIRLPAIQAGSSFFPGKVNPVVPETVIQCCFQVIGLTRSVQAALEHGELNLNVWEGMAGANVLDALRMLERAVRLFGERCVAGIAADEERCRALSRTWIPVVTELRDRYGYGQVSRWLKQETREQILKRYES
jgi:Aspartate ammonia-lyase